jgi:hypothetical protein
MVTGQLQVAEGSVGFPAVLHRALALGTSNLFHKSVAGWTANLRRFFTDAQKLLRNNSCAVEINKGLVLTSR